MLVRWMRTSPLGLGQGHWLEGLLEATPAAEQVHGARPRPHPGAAGRRLAPRKAQLSFAHRATSGQMGEEGQPEGPYFRKLPTKPA